LTLRINIWGGNMKIIIILLVLIPVFAAFPQEISASRNTMEISNVSNPIDSITIYNNGTNSLIVDSIQCEETNFLLSIGQFCDSVNWVPIEEYFNATNVIEIQPTDSFQVRISFLAIICKLKQIKYGIYLHRPSGIQLCGFKRCLCYMTVGFLASHIYVKTMQQIP